MNRRQQRIRFFAEHAGYCTPPGRMACAKALADAEEQAKLANVDFVWEYDECCDESFVDTWPEHDQRKWHSIPHECLMCTAYLDGEALAGLGGIFDPDADYRRVIEAELAMECLDALKHSFAI